MEPLHSSDDILFRQRAGKEAIHELGHTWGLGHCRNPRCIMFFSDTPHDTDVKGPGFCAACKEKVNRGMSGGRDPVEGSPALLNVCNRLISPQRCGTIEPAVKANWQL